MHTASLSMVLDQGNDLGVTNIISMIVKCLVKHRCIP